MSDQPNVLVLMCDQMQGRVLGPESLCQTPNFDKLAARGIRFSRAYTPNAVCSPARASLMTGLLPHNHGVYLVTHCVPEGWFTLADTPHWAQRLQAAGYQTGYFGKWHVENQNDLGTYGWGTYAVPGSDEWKARRETLTADLPDEPTYSHAMKLQGPPGYPQTVFYGVTDVPPEKRPIGINTSLASDYLDEVMQDDSAPWCCFVSISEPHDPYITGEEAYALYDPGEIKPFPNWDDNMADKPAIYRRSACAFKEMSLRQKQEAAACYYASITEIDKLYGALIDKVEEAGQLDNTIIVLTGDHGDFLGAHGLYCKNIGAFEEAYQIPLILAGPGIASGVTSDARVGSIDLGETLLEMTGSDPLGETDSRSFAPVLRDPGTHEGDYTTGYAEYWGQRTCYVSQRVLWDGAWKFIFNGFDWDELYNLDEDPYEIYNLANDPAHEDRVKEMMKKMWRIWHDTGDDSFYNSNYPPYRFAACGPLAMEE